MKHAGTHSLQDIASISERIIQARESCKGLSEYPGLLPRNLETAYCIQDLSMSKWSDRLVGWKVGGIPPHLQAEFDDTRLCGPIYASNVKHAISSEVVDMPVFEDGFAAIEAEFIAELGDVSSLPSSSITEQDIYSVINQMYIGVEIASSPIQRINDLGPVGPVSDFGNNSGMIVGKVVPNWRELDLSSIAVSVEIDHHLHGPTHAPAGLNGPAGAIQFLVERLSDRGHKLAPGTLVCTGAITGVHDSNVGARSKVVFDGLGEIELQLSAKN